MGPIILVADNDEKYARELSQKIIEGGYQAVIALGPEAAKDQLRDGRIDLAVLDVRLDNDGLRDDSGLKIATDEAFLSVPKIMLTGHRAAADNISKLVGPNSNKLPYAIAFVEKKKGTGAIMDAIHRALELWPSLRTLTMSVSERSRADYAMVVGQAKQTYNLALTVSVIGFAFILLGMVLALFSGLAIGVVGSLSGIVTQALGYLFFRRLDLSNSRMDSYHRELLETYWLELLLSASTRLPSDRRLACSEAAISSATRRWLGNQLHCSKTLAPRRDDSESKREEEADE